MAVVDGLTKARMLAIEANSVVDGDVNASGNLVLYRHDGTPIDAGHVVGTPGVSITSSVIDENGDLIITYSSGAIVNVGRVEGSDAPAHKVSNYGRGVNYVQNDIVNFAGRLYKSKTANVEKRPPFYSADWEVVSPAPNGWVQIDPFFLRQDWDQWELWWATSGVVRAYTSVAGEFVTGHRALKLTIPAGGRQRIFPKELNLVGGGERIVTVVKARLLTAQSTNVEIVGTLYQAGEDGHPEPLGSGASDANAEEGAQSIGASWTDFTFSNTAAYELPQARVNVVVFNNDTETAEVLIDQIYTRDPGQVTKSYVDDAISAANHETGWQTPSSLLNGWVNYGGAYNNVAFRKEIDGSVRVRGLIKNGTFSSGSTGRVFLLPAGYRPASQYIFSAVVGDNTHGRVDVTPSGYVCAKSGSSNSFLSLDGIRFDT